MLSFVILMSRLWKVWWEKAFIKFAFSWYFSIESPLFRAILMDRIRWAYVLHKKILKNAVKAEDFCCTRSQVMVVACHQIVRLFTSSHYGWLFVMANHFQAFTLEMWFIFICLQQSNLQLGAMVPLCIICHPTRGGVLRRVKRILDAVLEGRRFWGMQGHRIVCVNYSVTDVIFHLYYKFFVIWLLHFVSWTSGSSLIGRTPWATWSFIFPVFDVVLSAAILIG